MGLRRFKKYAIGAGGMLVLVAAVVLATGSGSAVAAQITSVFVTNDASHPVPVHEQGTANVNVTNSSLPAANGRLLKVAENVDTSATFFDTPWIDTRDCHRTVTYGYWNQYVEGLDLQTTADPTVGPTGSYPPTDQQLNSDTSSSVFEYSVGGQPVVGPFSRVRIQIIGAHQLKVGAVYLYCVR